MKGYFDFYKKPYPVKEKLIKLVELLENHEETGLQFIAHYDKQAIGFTTLYKAMSTLSAGKIIVLNDLYVEPSVRGKGIGRALMEHSKEYAVKNNYPHMEWMTKRSNEQAKNLYDRLGAQKSEWTYYSW